MLHLTSHCENGDCVSFEYDGAGNRVSEASSAGMTAYALEPGTDRLAYTSGANAHELAYDGAGAAWRVDGAEIARDAMGRFVSARENGIETLAVYYDADGRRVSIDREGAPVFLHYQGERVAGELTAAGRYVDYIYMPAGREPVAQVAEGETVYLTHDAYGRVDGALSSAGHELWRFAGLAHDRNPAGLQIANYPFRNSGRYAATENFHFLGNRTYVPGIDRFIEADEALERETARGWEDVGGGGQSDVGELAASGYTLSPQRSSKASGVGSRNRYSSYVSLRVIGLVARTAYGFANNNMIGFAEDRGEKDVAIDQLAAGTVLGALLVMGYANHIRSMQMITRNIADKWAEELLTDAITVALAQLYLGACVIGGLGPWLCCQVRFDGAKHFDKVGPDLRNKWNGCHMQAECAVFPSPIQVALNGLRDEPNGIGIGPWKSWPVPPVYLSCGLHPDFWLSKKTYDNFDTIRFPPFCRPWY